VPDERFHSVQRQPRSGPVHFLFLGNLGHRKGGDVFLRSLQQLDLEWKATVVGATDEKLEQSLRSEIPGPWWSRVEFKRQLAPEQVAGELARATILVCPTRADTGPMAVKEAAVAGVPVVGSDVGGIPDYVTPDGNGLLFPSGDVAACADAMRKAAGHPMFGRGAVDEAVLARVREQLAPRRMAGGFLEAYQAVVARNSSV